MGIGLRAAHSQKKGFFKRMLLVGGLVFGSLVFALEENFIELTQFLNARSTAFFRGEKNVLTQLSTGTKAEILQRKLFYSGNYGLKIKVLSGTEKGKEVWVHFNKTKPGMKLFKDKDFKTEVKAQPETVTSDPAISSATALATEREVPAVREPSSEPSPRPTLTPPPSQTKQLEAQGECKECASSSLDFARDYLLQHSKGLRPDHLQRAQEFLKTHPDTVKNRRYIAIVDYSKPSSEPRLYIRDQFTGEVTAHLTSHGVGSGEGPWATSFSNKEGSLQSSLGCFTTGEQYSGEFGASMRLDGQEATNKLARKRSIVLHPWEGTSPEHIRNFGFLGQSEGCITLVPSESKAIIEKLKGGALICSYN